MVRRDAVKYIIPFTKEGKRKTLDPRAGWAAARSGIGDKRQGQALALRPLLKIV